MHRTLVLLVVGLTPDHLGEHTPHLQKLARRGAVRPLDTLAPAVTCSVQSTFTTGLMPCGHGCVANGWYFRDLAEILFWRQSNALVHGEKIWDEARRRNSDFTCAKLFWWYNMYADVDWAVTPRPQYLADGRKLPDIHTHPASLRDELNARLGTFPLFQFWGPASGIASTEWIGRCAMHVVERHQPTLTLVYLPHLDYSLQKIGPSHPGIPAELRAVDAVCGQLIEQAERTGTRVIVLSEYGITEVSGAVFPNRALRQAGLIQIREESGRELLDAGASEAFAVCDHQIAHVYVRRHENIARVQELLESLDGVERVLDREGQRAIGLDHERSGELVAISRSDRWFAYYHWLDDARAMDFARTVEIHRKPGYDPVELFVDPAIRVPQLAIGWRLARRKMGFRTLMDVIPLDASLVKGSHGRVTDRPGSGPIVISSEAGLLPEGRMPARRIKECVLAHVFGPEAAS